MSISIAASAAHILSTLGCEYQIKTPEGFVYHSNTNNTPPLKSKKEKFEWALDDITAAIAQLVETGDVAAFSTKSMEGRMRQSFISVIAHNARKKFGERVTIVFDKEREEVLVTTV